MNQIPTQVSESVRRKNPHLYGEAYAKEFCTPKPAKRIRQSSKPVLNKLEQEFLDWLERVEPGHGYIPQSVRFKLANGLWYKPDVVSFDLITCWEVKGPYAYRGGFENLKMAAHQYPIIIWKLVWKENGQWKEQIVLP